MDQRNVKKLLLRTIGRSKSMGQITGQIMKYVRECKNQGFPTDKLIRKAGTQRSNSIISSRTVTHKIEKEEIDDGWDTDFDDDDEEQEDGAHPPRTEQNTNGNRNEKENPKTVKNIPKPPRSKPPISNYPKFVPLKIQQNNLKCVKRPQTVPPPPPTPPSVNQAPELSLHPSPPTTVLHAPPISPPTPLHLSPPLSTSLHSSPLPPTTSLQSPPLPPTSLRQSPPTSLHSSPLPPSTSLQSSPPPSPPASSPLNIYPPPQTSPLPPPTSLQSSPLPPTSLRQSPPSPPASSLNISPPPQASPAPVAVNQDKSDSLQAEQSCTTQCCEEDYEIPNTNCDTCTPSSASSIIATVVESLGTSSPSTQDVYESLDEDDTDKKKLSVLDIPDVPPEAVPCTRSPSARHHSSYSPSLPPRLTRASPASYSPPPLPKKQETPPSPPAPTEAKPREIITTVTEKQNLMNRPLPQPPAENGEVQETQSENSAPPDEQNLKRFDWYHSVERAEAEQKVRQGRVSGMYLIRESRRGGLSNPYTLTIFYKDKVYHLNIRKRPDQMYALGSAKSNELTFVSLAELVKIHHADTILLSSKGAIVGQTCLVQTPPKEK